MKIISGYIVIKCLNCQNLSFIRSNQKSATCKKCGIKNKYKKITQFLKASLASEYIRNYNLKKSHFSGSFQRME
ncbi:MAG: DUF5817 domain-containing protein [Candidatus Helarchaeota archaeon]